jgi:hypothetical protein
MIPFAHFKFHIEVDWSTSDHGWPVWSQMVYILQCHMTVSLAVPFWHVTACVYICSTLNCPCPTCDLLIRHVRVETSVILPALCEAHFFVSKLHVISFKGSWMFFHGWRSSFLLLPLNVVIMCVWLNFTPSTKRFFSLGRNLGRHSEFWTAAIIQYSKI